MSDRVDLYFGIYTIKLFGFKSYLGLGDRTKTWKTWNVVLNLHRIAAWT